MQTNFPGKPEVSQARTANTRTGKQIGGKAPYLSSRTEPGLMSIRNHCEFRNSKFAISSSIISPQPLIQFAGSPAIGKTVMRDFIKPALLEIIGDFASVDSILRGIHAKDLAKKLEGPFPVSIKIGENFANIEVPFGAESPGIEDQVARNRHAHNRAPNVDVWEVERFSIERDKPLRPDLSDVAPEIGE